jgi:6-phosphogluconolactonase/glucosamine-6-phosphate isomerase/deaminase
MLPWLSRASGHKSVRQSRQRQEQSSRCWPAPRPCLLGRSRKLTDRAWKLATEPSHERRDAHLGLGPDGHTASLVPDDPVLNVTDRDVALTGTYMKRRRMTLTYPMLNRSRRILWLVTGTEKVAMLPRLLAADASIPAGRVQQEQARVLADQAAAEKT